MTHLLSSYERENTAKQLANLKLDVLVIGGGITGAGILLDATSRGMTVGLIEMQDFAAGTSSRSTKLVHGGLRYLKQLEIKLVAEVGRERAIVYENGMHVTTPVWMLLPIVDGGTYGRFATSLALFVYDTLARVRRRERHKMLDVNQALSIEPLLRASGLKGAGYYVEYRTDDARLTLENIKEAVHRGGLALNYTRALSFLTRENKVVGVRAQDVMTGNQYEIHAKHIVNATGPWVDHLRGEDGWRGKKSIRHTKGVHLVVDESRFPLQSAVYFDVSDGRMVFAIPRDGKTYIGTTDTDYQGDLVHPTMSVSDRDYLLACVNEMFPSVALTAEDVESSWAGVRPLIQEEGKSPSEVSRRDEVFVSPSGLITIAGGKLTGYRKMARKVVNLVSKRLAREEERRLGTCQTARIRISGGQFEDETDFQRFIEDEVRLGVDLGLTEAEALRLTRRYGSNVQRVFAHIDEARSAASAPFGLPPGVLAELMYGMHEEMVMSPADFFIRRTGALYFDIEFVHRFQHGVTEYMRQELRWSDVVTEYFRDDLACRVREAIFPNHEAEGSQTTHPLLKRTDS